MANSFAELRRNREQLTQKLADKINEKDNNNQNPDDASYWKLTIDKKTGAGHAVIRFLSPPKGEDLPYVKYIHHGFQGDTGQYYIEKSRRTLGESDPVAIYNSQLWKTQRDADKKKVQRQAQRTSFVSNILVISDPENRDNEGKVFRFRYGKSIYGKIEDMMSPEMGRINVFDLWEGANFLLRAYGESTGGKIMPKYDRSTFQAASPLFPDPDDKKFEDIWSQCYPLKSLIDPSTFKSFDDLHARLELVEGQPIRLNGNTASKGSDPVPSNDSKKSLKEELDDEIPHVESNTEAIPSSNQEEFDESYFDQLASGKK